MVGDGYSWLWNNPVTREVVKCPKKLGDLVWGDHHHHRVGADGVTFVFILLRITLSSLDFPVIFINCLLSSTIYFN